jgi:hypothetical protein
MLLDRLLFECTQHYRDRGLPDSALMHLRWVLITHTCKDQIELQTAYQRCSRKVEELLGHFKPCPQIPDQADFTAADAIFGFAFGYQMKQWSNGIDPLAPDEVAANRIPGANNAVLAERARQLHMTHSLDLYLQFEIADAIGKTTSVVCTSKRIDQGTQPVLKEFLDHAANNGKKIHAAVVVAHGHHYERCRLLLEEQRIRAIQPPNLYLGYDPLEAQPRVMTPEEWIVNDFASMAAMVKIRE